MNLPEILIRSGTRLPDGLDVPQQSFCEGWAGINNTPSWTLDKLIRERGWHFVCLVECNSRFAFASSAGEACKRAAIRALSQIEGRFNCAHLGSVTVTKWLWFFRAKVSLDTRQIQQHSSLGLVDEMLLREVSL